MIIKDLNDAYNNVILYMQKWYWAKSFCGLHKLSTNSNYLSIWSYLNNHYADKNYITQNVTWYNNKSNKLSLTK